MDLRTIKTFKTIVKCGSFQKAAEELMYAQSTITTHIKNLEADLGVILLERGKKLQLTEAGRLLNEKGDLLLKGFENLENAMADLVQGEAGMIRIGVMEPTASYRFPELLVPFAVKYPKVQLSVQIHSSKAISDMITQDEIDLALCAAPDTASGMVFEPLFSEEVVLLLPIDHPISHKEKVSIRDLQNESLIATSSFCPFRNNLERQMLEAGINPRYEMEVSNMLAAKYYVQAGFGIAVVPLVTVTPPPSGLIIRPISDFERGLTVGIVRREERFNHGSVEYLLELIRENLSNHKTISY